MDFVIKDDGRFGLLEVIAWVSEESWEKEYDGDYSNGEITGEQADWSTDKWFDEFLIVFNLEIFDLKD